MSRLRGDKHHSLPAIQLPFLDTEVKNFAHGASTDAAAAAAGAAAGAAGGGCTCSAATGTGHCAAAAGSGSTAGAMLAAVLTAGLEAGQTRQVHGGRGLGKRETRHPHPGWGDWGDGQGVREVEGAVFGGGRGSTFFAILLGVAGARFQGWG